MPKNTSVVVKRLATTVTKSKLPTAVDDPIPVSIANSLKSSNSNPVSTAGMTEEEKFALQQRQQSQAWSKEK